MKIYARNLYWRATLKRFNEGVDSGRWNVTKKSLIMFTLIGLKRLVQMNWQTD